MIAVVKKNCSIQAKADIVRFVESEGFRVQVSEHADESLVGVIGIGTESLATRLADMPGVVEIRPVAPPYPLVSREHHPGTRRVKVNGVAIGGTQLVVMAGPCAVESAEQILTVARTVAAAARAGTISRRPAA